MRTNVKPYTDKQILDRMKSLPSYRFMPSGYHIIVIRSKEDEPDIYDDKLYLFKGEKFISVMPCTSNSGSYGLLNYKKWNSKGAAVIKFDEIYYNVYFKSDGKKYRHHNGKVQCLRQVGKMYYYRDNNNDLKIDECGELEFANNSTNVHPNSYKHRKGIVSWLIGGWGTGCIVVNDLSKYFNVLLEKIPYDYGITLTGLKEF